MKQLPDYGPLEINDLDEFLKESKMYVDKNYDLQNYKSNLKYEDLKHIQTIGSGSFGTVVLMRNTSSNEMYAVKIISKKLIVKNKQVSHILNEKKILSVMNFPFVVHLIEFYSDNSYLYFVLPFISGGDLFIHLRKFFKLDETQARFYSAQVVLAIQYLHFLDIVYRDLKPENVLMDHTGYLKLTDFGFGKTLKTRTWTLCGTPEYLAPEVVLNRGYSKSVDWWAVGVFIFEMISGRSPFHAKEPLKIYEKIITNRFVCPPDMSKEAKELITGLLQSNISLRLGTLKNGVDDIKNHPWYKTTNWYDILNRKEEPSYIPPSVEQGENFSHYKDIKLIISETNRFNKEFEHFYNNVINCEKKARNFICS